MYNLSNNHSPLFQYLLLAMLILSPCISHAKEKLPWLSSPALTAPPSAIKHMGNVHSTIEEQGLSPVSAATVGLINAREGSLGNHMWRGTNDSLAQYFLTYLPIHSTSDTLKSLRFRLLTTAALLPQSNEKNSSDRLNELRIKQLAAMKEYDAIRHLISKLPTRSITESIHQTLVVSLIKTNHYDKACSHTAITIKYFNTPTWQQLLTLCHILQQEWSKAELYTQLLSSLPVTLQTLYTFENWTTDQYQPSNNEIDSIITAIIPLTPLFIKNTDEVTLPPKLPLQLRLISNHWWHYISTFSANERLNKIGQLYNYLDATNYKIDDSYWETALRSSPTPPASLALHLLENAAQKKQVGKTIALILFSAQNTTIPQLDTHTLSSIIRALHKIKLHEEAMALTKEFLNSSLPNDIKPFTIQQTIN